MKRLSILFTFLSFVTLKVSGQNGCIQGVNCHLPSCFCSTFEHPTLRRSEIPQMVYFGFDDALTPQAAVFYDQLFTPERKNPNGCPITMSLYVSNQYTYYTYMENYYKKGFELAVHSVTHTHIRNRTAVRNEATAQRRNIAGRGKVPISKIVGWRSPFLETAGDDQVDVLSGLNFEYDISLTYKRDKMNHRSPWPFTADFGWPYHCQIRPCPAKRHPGFWEVPVNAMRDYKDQFSCGYVDGCYNGPRNVDESYKYLMDNFLSYYNGNRAPYGFNMHYAWFMTNYNLEAMKKFIDRILQYDDVYIVTVKNVLEWMKNPTSLRNIKYFAPWSCGQTRFPQRRSTRRATTTTTTTTTTTPTTPKPTTTTTTPKPTTTTTKQTTTTTTTTQKPTTRRRIPTTTSKWSLWWFRPIVTMKPKPVFPTKFRPIYTMKPKPTIPTKLPSTTQATRPNKPHIPRPVGGDVCQQGLNCHLPNCFCKGTTIPGGLALKDTPQMVYLTFDGSINYNVYSNAVKFFPTSKHDARLNPNGCPAKATFFSSQPDNAPWYLKFLNNHKMEIAMMGYHGENYNDQHILNEEIQLQISELANMQIGQPKGWRSPDLKPLGEGQYEKLMKYNFRYDASLTIPRETSGPKQWPFTLDFGYNDKCVIPECPKMAYPGLWEVPNTPIIDYRNLYICNFVDGCMNSPPTANDTFNFLWNNFLSHYESNKAPFGLHLRHTWFSHPFFAKNIAGLKMFLDKLSELQDVYVVPIKDIITWVSNPTRLSDIKPSGIWRC